MKQLDLKVSGMSCSGCEQRIETTLARLEGVIRTTADHRTGEVNVVIDPKRSSEELVRASIERTGYEVSA